LSVHVSCGEGAARLVESGDVVTFQVSRGTQVVDLNIFKAPDFNEVFSSSATRVRNGVHLTAGDRLFTQPPWERPIATILEDSLGERSSEARPHDLLFGRCSAALREHIYGYRTPGCQEILSSAIEEFGLTELAVHDPLNLFMTTAIDDDKPYFTTPETKTGDLIRIQLHSKALVAFSCCPGASSGPDPGGIDFIIE